MWNKPQLLSAISDLLYVAAAAALLVAAVLWSTRLPLFPLRQVVVKQELHEVRRSDLERSLAGNHSELAFRPAGIMAASAAPTAPRARANPPQLPASAVAPQKIAHATAKKA